jgi:hypothetical protein
MCKIVTIICMNVSWGALQREDPVKDAEDQFP